MAKSRNVKRRCNGIFTLRNAPMYRCLASSVVLRTRRLQSPAGSVTGGAHNMVMQCAVLGNGDADTEDFFRWLSARIPDASARISGFSVDLSHLIEAGSDFFLMPSLYEPLRLETNLLPQVRHVTRRPRYGRT